MAFVVADEISYLVVANTLVLMLLSSTSSKPVSTSFRLFLPAAILLFASIAFLIVKTARFVGPILAIVDFSIHLIFNLIKLFF